jgi:CRP/FNR family transcriptional regulator
MLDYALTGVLDYAPSDRAVPKDRGRPHSHPQAARLLPGEIRSLCEQAGRRILVRDGITLVRRGQLFRDLYAVYAGSFKACNEDAKGRPQRLGFFLHGDIIGFDAMDTGRHPVSFIAMEESEVIALPFDALHRFVERNPELLSDIMKRMARKIAAV